MDNWKAIVVGFLNKKERKLDLNLEFNKPEFPDVDADGEEFLNAMNKCIAPILGVVLELQGEDNNNYDCVEMPFIGILMQKEEDKVVYKLTLNSYYTRAFTEDLLLIDRLTGANVGTSMIQFGEEFNHMIGCEIENVVSETEIQNFNGNTMFELAVGYCNGEMRSEFVFNNELFISEKQPLEDFQEKLNKTDVSKAVDDISHLMQSFIMENKEAFSDNNKAVLIDGALVNKDGAKLKIDVKVCTENQEVLDKANQIMLLDEVKQAMRYINSELLKLIQ